MLAVGEGPSAWTDFFTQQMRWSRGTYETILKQYWKGWYSLPPSKLFNYTMMIIFYPMSALNWILAALSCCLFLGLGASGVNIDPAVWLMLYGNASALQIGLYVWNRRHNVSPHEPEGSGGVAGMVMSALSAPLYAKALIDSVLRRKSKFVVTPKGDSASPDRWFGTFRYHWYFVAIFGALDHRRLRLRPLPPRDDHLGDVRAADHRLAGLRLALAAAAGREEARRPRRGAAAGFRGAAPDAAAADSAAAGAARPAAQAQLGRRSRRKRGGRGIRPDHADRPWWTWGT